MPKVLVTSGSTRIAYVICCALAQEGYDVYIGDRSSFTMAGMSRYCKGRMRYPSPFTAQESFIDSLIDFAQKEKIDILLPVLEETFTCLKYKDKLINSGIATLLPEYTDALTLHAKSSLTSTAKELGIDTPPTIELTELLACKENYSKITCPAIVKPKQGGGGWGMQRFSDINELVAVTSKEIPNPENYIVQSIITGEIINVCGLYYKGEHIISDSYTTTSEYPLHVGQSTTRITRSYPQAIESLKTLLSHLKWNGVCEMDFIYDEINQKSYLIDANPRFWGSLKQNIAAGVNYPLYCALLAQDKTNFTPKHAIIGTRSRWLGGDILRIIAECRESSEPMAYLKKTIFHPEKYAANDDWDIKDPLPFITWGINLVLNKILKRKKDALPGIWE